MSENEDPELEFSPLGWSVTRDGITVQVHIYRLIGTDEGWALEVVDGGGSSTTWDEMFASEQDALSEFNRQVDESGIRSFLEEPDATLH